MRLIARWERDTHRWAGCGPKVPRSTGGAYRQGAEGILQLRRRGITRGSRKLDGAFDAKEVVAQERMCRLGFFGMRLRDGALEVSDTVTPWCGSSN